MSKLRFVFIILITILTSIHQTKADDHPIFLAPQISTLGVGIETGYRFNDYIGIRGDINYFAFMAKFATDEVKYKVDAQLKSFGVLGDVYPWGHSFRITGGLRANYNNGKFSTNLASVLPEIDPTSNTSDFAGISGRAEFPQYAPYVGIGWSRSLFRDDIYFGADLGVMFQGRGKVVLNSNDSMAAQLFQSEIDDQQKSIQAKLAPFRYFPVVSFSIGYRF